MLRGLDPPPQGVLLLSQLVPPPKGRARTPRRGAEAVPRPLRAGARAARPPRSHRCLQRVTFHFPSSQFPADAPKLLPVVGIRGVTLGGARQPLPQQGRASEGPRLNAETLEGGNGVFSEGQTGRDWDPLQLRYLPGQPQGTEQFGSVLGGDNQTLAGAGHGGLLPVLGRKPPARGAVFFTLWSFGGAEEMSLHPLEQGHSDSPTRSHGTP